MGKRKFVRCGYCGKVINKPPRFYWKGLSDQYCSVVCAAWGCDNAILIKDDVIEGDLE